MNDGVCDCCDGSDEHDGRVTCEKKRCIAMGASRRAELAEKVKRAKGGSDKKRALVSAAPAKREAWQKEIDQLSVEIEKQKLKVRGSTRGPGNGIGGFLIKGLGGEGVGKRSRSATS